SAASEPSAALGPSNRRSDGEPAHLDNNWPAQTGAARVAEEAPAVQPEPTSTATARPPTATPVPPTSTPVPPTSTPVPPTSTPVPPTSTPGPPTSTPTASHRSAGTTAAQAVPSAQTSDGGGQAGPRSNPTTAPAGSDRTGTGEAPTGQRQGQGGTGGQGAPTGAAAPVAPSSSSVALAIVGEAMKHIGKPYALGASGPAAFDCSGFTRYVYAQAGIAIPRDLAGQVRAGPAVAVRDLVAGDLVFFSNTFQYGLSHSGVYLGGGKFIHAGSERTGVTISSMSDSYWSSRFTGASRPARR
ncbi:MAG TPA: NlpC/P60 family protein, partial [Dehalococcoidia bacterium]|nr:NlpC/P60 family protein [Dehalococcoidia bacterium]